MTIDPDRWIGTIPHNNIEQDKENNTLNTSKWINTIPKQKNYNPLNTIPKQKNYNPLKKYSITTALFIIGLIFVSLMKEETRNLQKEINKLEASVNHINQDLHQAILDYEVITSPKNLSELAEKYLETDLISYKHDQIQSLNKKKSYLTKDKKKENKKNIKEKTAKLTNEMKIKIRKKIKTKKKELKKLQTIYSEPKKLPQEIRSQVSKKIKKTKKDLKKLYKDPTSTIEGKKIERWMVVQVVKAFFGMPVIPGR